MLRLPIGFLGTLYFPVVIAGVISSRRNGLLMLAIAALASFATIAIEAQESPWTSVILVLVYIAAAWIALTLSSNRLKYRTSAKSTRTQDIAAGLPETANTPAPGIDEPPLAVNGRQRDVNSTRSTDQMSREIIASAAQGIVVFDRDLRCIVWNHAMEYATGVTAARAIGQSALNGLSPYLPAEGSLILNKALKGDVVTAPDFSYPSNNPAKPLTWVACTCGPHRNGSDAIIGVIAMLRDVTERVAAEERLAALYADTVEALDRERRYNEIARFVSSSLELKEVLKNIARITGELFGAEGVVFSLAQADGSMALSPESYQETPGVENVSALLQEPLRQVMLNGESVLIEDYAQQPRSMATDINSGLHSCLAAPLTAGSSRLGAVALYSLRPAKHFGERDLTVLEMVGRQAGLAIQRARLVEDAQRMAQEAETLRQAGAAVTSTLRLHETFERILQQLERVVPYDSASIQLLRDGFCEVVDVHGWLDPMQVIGIRFPVPGDNPNTAVIQERRSVIRNDVDFSHISIAGDIRSWMGVP
ncbi:MAG TPA: GAF domain-containing protein, partial [Anaerolineae bacterium]